jgi:chromosome segregation ATPase
MSDRRALEHLLKQEQTRNLKLKAELDRGERRIAVKKSQIAETPLAIERDEEHMANVLLRRIAQLHDQKGLMSQRKAEMERRNAETSRKLSKLKQNSSMLQEYLRQEEEAIREKLEGQLNALRDERRDLEEKARAEKTTLHQLQQCIEKVVQLDAFGFQPHAEGTNSSPCTSASDTPVEQLASDLSMAAALEKQIAAVEFLQQEACESVLSYQSRHEELTNRILEAETLREEQRASVESIRQELTKTTMAVHEMCANSEVASEYYTDREILSHRRSPSVSSTATSTMAETPRVLHGGDVSVGAKFIAQPVWRPDMDPPKVEDYR